MILIPFPNLPAATVDWQLLTVSETFGSPQTGHEQTALQSGFARWTATLTWARLSRAEAADLEAFLVECDGPAGRFLLSNQARSAPRGAPAGAPVVDGGANYGGLVHSRGWTASRAGLLLRGDWVQIGDELKVLREDVNSDANGQADLRFKPILRATPADGSAIVTTGARAIFRLIDDNQVKFAYRKQTGDYQIAVVETWS